MSTPEVIGPSSTPTPVPILLYHSVGDDSSGPLGPYTSSVADFRDQMAWVADEGFTTLTVGGYTDMLAGRRGVPERPLLITFDDGLADFRHNALPVLRSYGHACTMYVTTAAAWRRRPRALGGRPTMSWAEVAALPDSGVEVGGHGHEHLQLDLLSSSRVLSQLRECRDLLEQETQQTVTSFAYPHGYHRAATRRLVERAGFASACAVKNRLSHLADDRWALARIMVTSWQSVPFLHRSIVAGELPLATRRERVRTSLWRITRLVRTRGRPLVVVTDL
jgi:peptidoglycan/xylan/chitin deacetylase (PgdA/CDA1 family)